jgi:hypothetical protein
MIDLRRKITLIQSKQDWPPASGNSIALIDP